MAKTSFFADSINKNVDPTDFQEIIAAIEALNAQATENNTEAVERAETALGLLSDSTAMVQSIKDLTEAGLAEIAEKADAAQASAVAAEISQESSLDHSADSAASAANAAISASAAADKAVEAANTLTATQDVKTATEAVKAATDTVKTQTEAVRDATALIRDAAEASKVAAGTSETNAKTSETNAANSARDAATSAANAAVAAANAQVNSDWNSVSGKSQILNKPVLAAVATTGSKADVGLGNVDNTSDVNKPISTATQTALNGKAASTGDTNNDFAVKSLTAKSLNGGAFGGFRNRIINGNGMVDQRYNGAVATFAPNASGYSVDRWNTINIRTNGGNLTVQRERIAINGSRNPWAIKFVNVTAGATAAGDNVCFSQAIEGTNMADFGWGTANGKPVTLSFYVTASVPGNYALAIRNKDFDRSYVCHYNVAAANVEQYVAITIPAETNGGAWGTDTTNVGAYLSWDLGIGSTSSTNLLNAWQGPNVFGSNTSVKLTNTANAFLRITGIQFELGPVATPFEFRPYHTELGICQRYYRIVTPLPEFRGNVGATLWYGTVIFSPMRATPTCTLSDKTNVCWDAAGTDFTPDTFTVGSANSQALSLTVVPPSGKLVAGVKNYTITMNAEL